MQRLVKLAKVVDLLGPIKGEKSLQKLIYLFDRQNNELGYSYIWKTYGPVSFQLQQDIEELRALRLITVKHENNIPIFDVPIETNISTFWRNRLAQCEFNLKSQQILNHLLQLDQRKNDPLFLEVIASIDYLERKKEANPVQSLIKKAGNRYSADFIQQSQYHWKLIH